MSSDFERFYSEMERCPCGHSFRLVDCKPEQLRGAGGKYLNKSVEHSAISNNIECQCPKCLLWFDAVTEEINQ